MTCIMNRIKLCMTWQNSVTVPTGPGEMRNCPPPHTKYKLCIAQRRGERQKSKLRGLMKS